MARSPMTQPVRAIELLKRPEIDYDALIKMSGGATTLNLDEAAELEIEIKYDGLCEAADRGCRAVRASRRHDDSGLGGFQARDGPFDRGLGAPVRSCVRDRWGRRRGCRESRRRQFRSWRSISRAGAPATPARSEAGVTPAPSESEIKLSRTFHVKRFATITQ